MIINYNFNDEIYPYEVDIEEYLKDLSGDKLIDIAKAYWDSEASLYDREYYAENDVNSVDELTSEQVVDLLIDADTDWLSKYLFDDIKDAYDDDAYEEYEDNRTYQEDPLGYYGMSQSDFI